MTALIETGSHSATLNAITASSSVWTPTTGITWWRSYWADDSNLAATAQGAGVSTLYDASGNGVDATSASGAMTMEVGDTSFNGKRSVRWPSSPTLSNQYTTANHTVQAQPFSIVAIAKWDDTSAARNMFDGTGTNNRHFINCDTSPVVYRMYAGVTDSGTTGVEPTPNTNTHMFVADFNGGSSAMYVDGVAVPGINSVGTQGTIGLRIGCAHGAGAISSVFVGRIAYIGLYLGGLITANSGWSTWKTLAADYYGLTLV